MMQFFNHNLKSNASMDLYNGGKCHLNMLAGKCNKNIVLPQARKASQKHFSHDILNQSIGLLIGGTLIAGSAVACTAVFTKTKCVTPLSSFGVDIGPGVLVCEDKQDEYTTCKSYPCGVCFGGKYSGDP